MAQCVGVVVSNGTQFLAVDTATPLDMCNLILFNQADYTTLSGFNQLAADYFRFDGVTFSYLLGIHLVLFVSSFGIGKVLNIMRKV